MSTEALLKLLIGVVAGTLIPGTATVVGLAWKASRDWTRVEGRIDELVRQMKQLVDRIDNMAGQLDSIRIWRASHQATSDAQAETLERLKRASRRVPSSPPRSER